MHEGTVDSTLDSHPWLTLAETAKALGISEKTARRRAKAGRLEARQVPTQHGPAWQVRLPNGVPALDRVDSTVPIMGTQASTVVQVPEVVALVALVDRLQVENRRLAEAAAVWQERARMLADQLALTAPSESPVDASTAPDPPDPTHGPSSPWWRVLWPW